MDYFSAVDFAQKHGGKDAVLRLIKLCNDPLYDLTALSSVFGESKPTMCRIRQRLFALRYVPRPGVVDYLRREQRVATWDIEEIDRAVKNESLTLIPGAI